MAKLKVLVTDKIDPAGLKPLETHPGIELVYLVAPMLSFHKDFRFLAQTIAPEIEIYRFDLNEYWRRNLKVLRREEI